MAKNDTQAHGRRFELEAVVDIADASYPQLEVDDIEYDDDVSSDDPEVE